MEYKRKAKAELNGSEMRIFHGKLTHVRSCIGRREAASLLGQQKVLGAACVRQDVGNPGPLLQQFLYALFNKQRTRCAETRTVVAPVSVSSVQLSKETNTALASAISVHKSLFKVPLVLDVL